MTEARYWSAGITLEYSETLGWAGSATLHDRGAEETLLDATLHTRYWCDRPNALSAIVDRLVREAESLGVVWASPTLSVVGDGEDPEVRLPANWRELLHEQSEHLGWKSAYSVKEVA